MKISLSSLIAGDSYHREDLASEWGYEDWHAIARGIVTPRGDNKIILFITEKKQKALTQYRDHFDGDELHIEGETNHAADSRLIKSETSGDEVHLFYRELHHAPFTYFGRVYLKSAKPQINAPTRFIFSTSRSEVLADSAQATADARNGAQDSKFDSDPEGSRRLRRHYTYERSRRNRAEAIRIHGTICKGCEFDFNRVYGAALARNYIEIHHVGSITIPNAKPDPKTDLVPLCSNCHSMVHITARKIMPVEELRKKIAEQRKRLSRGQ